MRRFLVFLFVFLVSAAPLAAQGIRTVHDTSTLFPSNEALDKLGVPYTLHKYFSLTYKWANYKDRRVRSHDEMSIVVDEIVYQKGGRCYVDRVYEVTSWDEIWRSGDVQIIIFELNSIEILKIQKEVDRLFAGEIGNAIEGYINPTDGAVGGSLDVALKAAGFSGAAVFGTIAELRTGSQFVEDVDAAFSKFEHIKKDWQMLSRWKNGDVIQTIKGIEILVSLRQVVIGSETETDEVNCSPEIKAATADGQRTSFAGYPKVTLINEESGDPNGLGEALRPRDGEKIPRPFSEEIRKGIDDAIAAEEDRKSKPSDSERKAEALEEH